MSSAIYQTYRPRTFSEVIGQEHIKQTLQGAITKDRIGHAYLFCGPRGTGKTTSARLFATAINCTDRKGAEPCNTCDSCTAILEKKTLDIIEIDAASHTGVDNIRELRESIKIPPQQINRKVYIIDEVHMLSGGAFNALLKTLEEPPAHALFILATTEAHKIPATILSRVQRFDFTTVSADDLLERLQTITQKEKATIDDDALRAIIRHTKGHVRDAESLLSQVLVLDQESIAEKDVSDLLGLTPEHAIEELLAHTLSKNGEAIITHLQTLIEQGSDIEFLHKELIEYARLVLLMTIDPKLDSVTMPLHTDEQKKRLKELAATTTKRDITTIITSLLRAREHSKYSPIPELPLQLALLETVHADEQPATPSVPSAQPNTQASNTVAEASNAPQNTAQTNSSVPATSAAATESAPPVAPKRKTIVLSGKGTQNTQPTTPAPAANTTEATPTSKEDNPATGNDDYVQNLRPIGAAVKTTIQEVHSQWNTIVDELKTINHPLGTCLESSSPIKIEIDTLLLATTFPFHKERIDELSNKQLIGQVLDKIFKETLNVRAVLKDSITTTEHQQIAQAQQAPTPSSTGEIPGTDHPSEPPSVEHGEQKTDEGTKQPSQAVKNTQTEPQAQEQAPEKSNDLAKAALEIFGGEMVG